MALSFIYFALRCKSIKTILKCAASSLWALLPLTAAGFPEPDLHMGAWFVSALLLGMAILYPLCLRHFKVFTQVVAPLTALLVLGALCLCRGSTLGPDAKVAFLRKGLIRAIAEISAGAALYVPVAALARLKLTRAGKGAVTCGIILSSVAVLAGVRWAIKTNMTFTRWFLSCF